MLSLILGFITGLAGPIAQVANNITDLNKMKVKAQSDTELAGINQKLEEAHDRKAVLIAEAGNRFLSVITGSCRLALTIPVIVILNKLLTWDKAVGSWAGCAGDKGILPGCETFTTDKLDANMWWVIIAVIGFYFLYDIGSRIFKR